MFADTIVGVAFILAILKPNNRPFDFEEAVHILSSSLCRLTCTLLRQYPAKSLTHQVTQFCLIYCVVSSGGIMKVNHYRSWQQQPLIHCLNDGNNGKTIMSLLKFHSK